MEREEQELVDEVPEFARYGAKFKKAIGTVASGGVKEARFRPSGRRIITVVGSLGDEFVDPEKPYCSCSNFYFKVLRGKEDACYHLLSYWIAAKTNRTDLVEFADEEYPAYFTATLTDVFEVLGRKGR